MRHWIKPVALAFTFALTIYLTSPVSSSWSHDRAYEATLLRKDCNLGETVFYSVRIDRAGAWFLRLEIEQSPFPDQAVEPAMKWDAHKLEIDIPAETFSGSIERRAGALTVVRSYTHPKS